VGNDPKPLIVLAPPGWTAGSGRKARAAKEWHRFNEIQIPNTNGVVIPVQSIRSQSSILLTGRSTLPRVMLGTRD